MNEELNPLSAIEAAIEKRRRKTIVRAENRATVASTFRLLAVVLVAVILFLFFFEFRIVDGNAMYPAVSDGDLVLVYKRVLFRKGEIVFYEVNGIEYCGRIVAKEGDNVDFSEDGKLFVNGTPQTTDIIFPTYKPDGWTGLTVVPEGSVYILGDYRTQAADSRLLGFIPKADVKSKVIALLRHKSL